MANPTITDNDSSTLPVFNPTYKQDMLRFTTAQTHARGLILARKQIATALVDAAGSNTGNGTITSDALAAGGPVLVGAYNIECVEAITNGGRFKLEDPNGLILDNQIIILAGAGGVVDYVGHGLDFTLTDGSTDFIVGDLFTLTAAVDGVLVPYAAAGVDGSEIPVAIMTRARTEATGADYPEKVLVAGEVDLAIIEVAQSATLSDRLKDQLRSIGIITRPAVVNDDLDNS